MHGRLLRYVNIGMFVLFLSWALFQLNDADALAWILVYGLAAVACALFFFGRLSPTFGYGLAALCILWAILLYYFVITANEPFTFVDDNIGEMLREAMGLTVVAGWSAFLSWRATIAKAHTEPS